MLPNNSELIFYIAPDNLTHSKDDFVYHTLLQAYQQGNMVGCLSPDNDYSNYLDDWLWSHQDSRFLPHTQLHNEKSSRQIYISHQPQDLQHCQQVINLTKRPFTDFLEQCTHIELVTQNDKQRQRENYRNYQQQGLQPKTRSNN